MKNTLMAGLLLAGAVFAAPFQSNAATQTYELDTQFNGSQIPGNTVPWLTATFTDGAPGVVLLSLTANSLVNGAYVNEWDFNFDPNLNLSGLALAVTNGGVGTVTTPTLEKGTNAFALNGSGGFADIKLAFAGSGGGAGQFTAGESIVLALTGVPGLNAAMFNFVSFNSTSGPWYTAAMVAGIPCPGCGGTTIAWIGDCTNTPNNAPEPATMAILGSFIAFGVYLKRRNSKVTA